LFEIEADGKIMDTVVTDAPAHLCVGTSEISWLQGLKLILTIDKKNYKYTA